MCHNSSTCSTACIMYSGVRPQPLGKIIMWVELCVDHLLVTTWKWALKCFKKEACVSSVAVLHPVF